MRRGLLFALLLLASRADALEAPATSMDVAPTTLELKPGAAGLFFVTNHGGKAVTVQIEAMDWRQDQGRDVLSPSRDLMTSPPMATIAPGARQSVRVLARPVGAGEHAYRLLVSELPDPEDRVNGVRVLLQFSVPVFVGHDPAVHPQLSWSAQGGSLRAANSGSQTVKLEGLSVNGAPRGPGLAYLLPGTARDFGAVTDSPRVHVHDGRSDSDIDAAP